MRCITCRTAPLALVLGALVLTPELVSAARGQEQGKPAQTGGQQGDAKPAEKPAAEKPGAKQGETGVKPGPVKGLQDLTKKADGAAQASGIKLDANRIGGQDGKPAPAPAPVAGEEKGRPPADTARDQEAGGVPNAGPKGPDARAQSERLATSVKLHEVRFARLDAVLAVFEAKNDSAKVARTQALKVREEARYQAELASFKQSLGDETYKKVLTSLRIAKKSAAPGNGAPAPKPGEKPAAERGKETEKKDGEKKDGGR